MSEIMVKKLQYFLDDVLKRHKENKIDYESFWCFQEHLAGLMSEVVITESRKCN